MGMYCTMRRVNEAELKRLREAPEQVSTFLYGEGLPLEDMREPGLQGCIMRLLGIRTQQISPTAAAEEPAKDLPQQTQNPDEIDLEKAWHGLHFLFTGTAEEGPEPNCFMLCGGEEIGDEDVGPARVLGPEQVSRFAAFLAELSRDELARRYDPARMTALEIYPDVIWLRPSPPGESEFDWLFAAFEELRDFVIATASRGDSMIVSIS